jgi:hypothetical protein
MPKIRLAVAGDNCMLPVVPCKDTKIMARTEKENTGIPASASLAAIPPDIDPLIVEARGQRVILDSDLARIYGVRTKAINQAVKRNAGRFPEDFLFKLTPEEVEELNRSQIVTGSQKHRDPRFVPQAFTEHGAIMAANVLNSAQAIQMSVFVVRAFVKMRATHTDNRELARKTGRRRGGNQVAP